MLFMVIYTTEPVNAAAGRKRAVEQGLPVVAGHKFINSWSSLAGHRTFSLVEVEDPAGLLLATAAWSDLGKFEVYPVMPREEANKLLSAKK